MRPLRRFMPGLALALIVSLAPVPASAASAKKPDPLAGWDAFVESARVSWKAPGVAIAIVKGNDVLVLKGYGSRDLEKKLPVTPSTIFAIGSCTKAFTTFVMGTLVDEGRLDWSLPVASYIPFFQLADRVATERMTPLDLVTHRSGMPRHDALWYNATLSRAEMVRRLRYLEPSKDFRTDFQYNNAMFLTAGFLVETITGKTWEEAVTARVLGPLGMKNTNFSVTDSQKSADFANPYEERDDKIVRMAFRNITNVGPAGSINSSVEDLVPWMKAHLNGGTVAGKSVLGAATVADLHLARMERGQKQTEPEVVPGGYAPGWFTDTYRGHLRVHHGGAIDGFLAEITLFPATGIGVAVLTNLNQGRDLPEVLVRHAADRLLGLPPHDWNGERLARNAKARSLQKDATAKKETARKTGTKPAHGLDEYTGDYEHPGYGLLKIARTGDQLEMTYNGITNPLEHWHYEVWNGAKIEDPAADHALEDQRVMFLTNMEGDVAAVSTPFEPAVAEIVFKKKSDARLSDPAYLSRLAGTYELGPQRVVLSLKGNVLTMEIEGRAQPDLVPLQGDKFGLKGVSGFTLVFLTDATGAVTGLQFVQPDGVYEAKRVK